MFIFTIKRPETRYVPGAWDGDILAIIAADNEKEAWDLSEIEPSDPNCLSTIFRIRIAWIVNDF